MIIFILNPLKNGYFSFTAINIFYHSLSKQPIICAGFSLCRVYKRLLYFAFLCDFDEIYLFLEEIIIRDCVKLVLNV
ncbi:MAG: hypothetical protein ACJAYB_001418 [Psychromonas sp.]|jgi:hypothetical protein